MAGYLEENIINKSNILEKHHPRFEYFESLMLVFLALQYLKFWIWPTLEDTDDVFRLTILLVFEFIMVHSGLMMALMPRKLSLLILFPFYGIFVFAFTKIIGTTVAFIYLFTVFNRMRFAFVDTPKALRKKLVVKSVLSLALYFLITMFVAFGSSLIPEFGLSSQYLQLVDHPEISNYSGLFIDEPKTAMSAGFLYCSFSAVAVIFVEKFYNRMT